MNIPTTAPKNGKLSELIIKVAHGEVLKKDYAETIGIDPTRVGARLNEDFANVIKELQADKSRLQDEASEVEQKIKDLQEDKRDLQAGASNMLAQITNLKSTANELQATANRLQGENKDLQDTVRALQESNNGLQATITRLEVQIARLTGKPKVIQFFGSPSTRAVLAILLAFFEMAGSMHLLLPKGLLLAVPVGIAMGFSLLAFASSDNVLGKWVCIVFSFAVGAIYFEPWGSGLPGDWLFAFVPPVVNAVIINSFKK